MAQHVFYKTEDPDTPRALKDRNGEVVMSQCRICRQAEGDLTDECPGFHYADTKRVYAVAKAVEPFFRDKQ